MHRLLNSLDPLPTWQALYFQLAAISDTIAALQRDYVALNGLTLKATTAVIAQAIPGTVLYIGLHRTPLHSPGWKC